MGEGDNADTDSLDIAASAAAYASVSASAFLIAVVVSYFVLRHTQGKENKGGRASGDFGKFMVALEAVDAVPEAAVLAQSAASGNMSWAFVLSIFMLNIANTLATSLDFMATTSNPVIHIMLFCSIFFAVGMLSFSISTSVYGHFDANMNVDDAIALFFGTGVGCLLIVALMKIEHHLHQDDEEEEDDAPDLADVARRLRRQMSLQQLVLTSGRYDNPEYEEQVRALYKERIESLGEVVNTLESAAQLATVLDAEISKDATDVVRDLMHQRVTDLETQYLLHSSNPSSPDDSLFRRAIVLFGMMFLIASWTVLLTFGLGFLFSWLIKQSGHVGSIANNFAEGLSGGSFLATIAGTMVPRLQQDAYRSRMDRLMYRTVGLLVFQAGLLFAVVLEIWTTLTFIKVDGPVH